VSLIFSELGEPWRGAGGLNFSRWHLFSDRCHLSVNKSQVLRLLINICPLSVDGIYKFTNLQIYIFVFLCMQKTHDIYKYYD
jgi:hypothetical protein